MHWALICNGNEARRTAFVIHFKTEIAMSAIEKLYFKWLANDIYKHLNLYAISVDVMNCLRKAFYRLSCKWNWVHILTTLILMKLYQCSEFILPWWNQIIIQIAL